MSFVRMLKFKIGMTILELVIVIGIMSVISAVVLANYPEFGGGLSLGRVAREVALSVRQAQVYGLGVRELTGPAQYPAYGIYFGAPDEFILFADTNGAGNGYYDSGDGCGGITTECVERYQLSSREFIDQLCIMNVDTGACDQVVEDLHVTFKRPEPEAYIRISSAQGQLFNGALIQVRSKKYPAKKQIIRVWVTGQISVLGQ